MKKKIIEINLSKELNQTLKDKEYQISELSKLMGVSEACSILDKEHFCATNEILNRANGLISENGYPTKILIEIQNFINKIDEKV